MSILCLIAAMCTLLSQPAETSRPVAAGAARSRPAAPVSVEDRFNALLVAAGDAPTWEAARQSLETAGKLLETFRGSLNSLDAAFLDADLLRTRGRAAATLWQRDRTQAELRQVARVSLEEALARYDQLADFSDQAASAVEDRSRGGDLSQNVSYRQAVGNVSRAHYATAWCLYSRGLIASDAERTAILDKAIEQFMSFTAHGYRNQAVVADCFLGQALCNYELQRYFEVNNLLAPATPDNTPPGTFKRITWLRIQTCQKQRRNGDLHEVADKYFAAKTERESLDSVELAMALEWARSLTLLAGDPAANPYYASYRKRLDKLIQRVYPYGDPWRSELARIVAKSTGTSSFAALAVAREQYTAGEYKQALEAADRGLQALTDRDRQDAGLLADLRYIRAAAAWSLKRWPDAFSAAFEFIRNHAKDGRADSMCTCAIRAGLAAMEALPERRSLLGTESSLQSSFAECLIFCTKQFPANIEVQMSPWYQAHGLIKAGKYAQAGQMLAAVRPDAPAYRAAQYGLALCAFKQAEPALRAGEGRATQPSETRPAASQSDDIARTDELLRQAAAALQRFIQAGASVSDRDENLSHAASDLALVVARCMLSESPPDAHHAFSLLSDVESLVKTPDAKSQAVTRDLLAIEALLRLGRIDEAQHGINAWRQQRPAGQDNTNSLLRIADALDAAYDRAAAEKAANATAVADMAVKLYTQLLDAPSGKPESGGGWEIAFRWRLAQALQRAGRPAQAIEHYRWMLANLPEEKAGYVVRGLATVYEDAGQYDEAIEQWRKLTGRLEQGNESGFDARVHLILCHSRAGRREHASRLFADLQLRLSADCPPAWSARLEEVGRELSRAGNLTSQKAPR